jgi:hypothetical protein
MALIISKKRQAKQAGRKKAVLFPKKQNRKDSTTPGHGQ